MVVFPPLAEAWPGVWHISGVLLTIAMSVSSPDLPALPPGKDGNRVVDRGILDACEIRAQQFVQLLGQDAEGRAFGLLAEEEIAGEQAARRQQFGNAPAPVGPQLARQGAEEGAFVDQTDLSCRGEGEKVGANEVDRSTRQNLAGLFDGDRRKIQRGNRPADIRQMGRLPGAAAAGDQCVERQRLAGDEVGEGIRNLAGIPGGDAFAKALSPEIGVFRTLFRWLDGFAHGFFRARAD